jgi:hypothetical protein
MLRIVLLVVGIAIAPVLADEGAAAEPAPSRSFKFVLVSQLEMQVEGQQQNIDADTDLRYTWTRDADKRILSFDSSRVKAKVNGQETLAIFMSREKFATREQGKTNVIPLDQAPPQLKTVLQESFGVPLCIRRVDENGREVKRDVVAPAGAKDMVDQGVLVNAMLFHPPFITGEKEWSAPAEISMGNGGIAQGELNYKLGAANDGKVVIVSGTISKDRYQQPNSPLTMKDAKYVVNGEQTYDTAKQDWVAGKLTMDISFALEVASETIGQAKGTIVATFSELPREE